MPAVVILDRVAQTVSEWRPAARIARILESKFLAPLLPGQDFLIELVADAAGSERVRFQCRRAETVIASGRIQLGECK